MKLNIAPMVVTSATLSLNADKPSDGHTNTFGMNGSVSFIEDNKTLAKLTTEAELISYGKYEVHITAEFILNFGREVTEEEAEKITEQALGEANIFPYISAYISTFVALSGFQRPSIPVVIFKE
ncbi:hypothetical protein GKQ23_13570 [Erwinia sp. E602]|uniref:hypothetical protein n=1 Tax=Erwinia sp. E602 TaxID=2675378 RepID=UPI001BACCC09|nr:hypothetical protein [Erwinia sp. E602]QUG75960.1 hypothetical protein GKQ23_13570 [Erwinia sp. E602]